MPWVIVEPFVFETKTKCALLFRNILFYKVGLSLQEWNDFRNYIIFRLYEEPCAFFYQLLYLLNPWFHQVWQCFLINILEQHL